MIGVAGISDYNLNLFLLDRGLAYKKIHNYENALGDVDRALEIDPDDIYSWVLRAFVNTKSGALDIAAVDFEKALALDPDRVPTLTSRAKKFYFRKEYEQALQDYQRVLEINPKHKLARERVVKIFLKRGEIDQAIAVLDQAIALYPDNPELYSELGKLHFTSTGDYEQALKALLRSDELDPNNSEILMYLGGVYFHLGDEELGKSYIEESSIADWENIYNNKNLPTRILYKLTISALWGIHSERVASRGIRYAGVGRPDLARLEFDNFIGKGGSNAVNLLRKYMRSYGFCSGPCLREGEGGEFYQELDRFIAYMDVSFTGSTGSQD